MPKDSKISVPKPNGQPAQTPSIAEPGKWLAHHFTKDWPLIAKAPIAFLAVLGLSLTISWWLTWQVVVPEKNEQLASKQGIIEGKQSEIDSLKTQLETANKEIDRLKADNAAYQAAHADKSTPLKNRATILARQLAEFSDTSRTNGVQGFILNSEWQSRFQPRLKEILDELDVQGQYSDKLPTGVYWNLPSPDDLKIMSSELNKLSSGLTDPQ